MNINKLQKKLDVQFSGAVKASFDGVSVSLTGSLPDWASVVRAGSLCADRKSRYYVVNDIVCPDMPTPASLPSVSDGAIDGAVCDALIIGGGVVGCAIARELSKYSANILLIDKEHDLAMHASSRNDGMIHAGADVKKSSFKFKYNMRGNLLYSELSKQLDFAFERCGQYICISKRLMMPFAYISLIYWRLKGVPDVRVLSKKQLFSREAGLAQRFVGALFFGNVGRVCPYGVTIALAENAAQNDVEFSLDTAALGMQVRDGQIISVKTNRGVVYPKVVINAAGVFADDIASMANDRFFSIHPRKGTDLILDKKTSALVEGVVAELGGQDKSAHSKGGGVVGTVDKNVLLGPSAQETNQREDFSTDPEIAAAVFGKHNAVVPRLSRAQVITYFSGVRAPTYEEDFVVRAGVRTRNIIHAAGIQSPGLTAAPAIAEDVAEMAARLVGAQRRDDFNPIRKGIPRTAELPDSERDALIKADADYGEIVCRCEQISRGEVRDALHRPIPCDTVDGVKRRVRAGMGRCQGGFCSPLVMSIISQELGIPLNKINKSSDGANMAFGDVKGGGDGPI